MRLVVELAAPDGWRRIGVLRPGGEPGSMSHNTPAGREVVVFACLDDHALVQRSVAGVDSATPATRVISSAGLELVARLGPGEDVVLWVRTDVASRAHKVRFRCESS